MSKKLVVYYSLSNNTKEAAECLAKLWDADLLRLVPEKDIPDKGAKMFLQGGGQALTKKAPALKPFEVDPKEYDEIILGTPIWAGKNVPATNTFLQDKGICEKIVGIFSISGGGSHEGCKKRLMPLLPNVKGYAELYDGRTDKAGANEAALKELVDKLA